MNVQTNDLNEKWQAFLATGTPNAQPKETLTCPRVICGGQWRATVGRGHWNYCPHCGQHFSKWELLH
jgi:hypothetical protein